MTSPMPPMPDANPEQGSNLNSLLGSQMSPSQQVAQQQQAARQAQDVLKQALQQFQSLDEQASNLARQFPEFAESARIIKDAIKDGMVAVVGSNARGTEAPTPSLL